MSRRKSPGFWVLIPGLLLAAVLIVFPAFAQTAEPARAFPWEAEVWRQATGLLVDEALNGLPSEHHLADGVERRHAEHARGLLLLDAQPKLQGNVTEARRLLESVRQGGAADELGLSALYYLARIAQFHAEPPDPGHAAALFEELLALAPDHPLAQQAASRLATLQLYEEAPPDERERRLARFEDLAVRLSFPPARRDLYLVLADARVFFHGDREMALRNLLAAEKAGILQRPLAGDTMVRIALLAHELGHREVALAHYREFLNEFQRDDRAHLLADQLRSIEAESTPAASTP